MNSLRINNQVQSQSNFPSQDFKNFAAGMNSMNAQAKLQEMIQTGQLSQQDFERAKLIAQSLLGK